MFAWPFETSRSSGRSNCNYRIKDEIQCPVDRLRDEAGLHSAASIKLTFYSLFNLASATKASS